MTPRTGETVVLALHDKRFEPTGGGIVQRVRVSCDEAADHAVEVCIVDGRTSSADESRDGHCTYASRPGEDDAAESADSSWDIPPHACSRRQGVETQVDNEIERKDCPDPEPVENGVPDPPRVLSGDFRTKFSFDSAKHQSYNDSGSLEERAESILSDARSALLTRKINIPQSEPDEKTRRVIDQALQAKGRSIKLRSTQEVLQMAGHVLETHRLREQTSDEAVDNPIQTGVQQEPETDDRFDDLRIGAFIAQNQAVLPSESLNSLLNKSSDSTQEETKHASFVEPRMSSFDEPRKSERFSLMGFLRKDFVGSQACGSSYERSRMNFGPWACGATGAAPSDIMSDNSIADYEPLMSRKSSVRSPVWNETPDSVPSSVFPSVADVRMPEWIIEQKRVQEGFPRALPDRNFYCLEKSRTVIVHEIARGNWTWCTAWAPDGNRLAVATENHHLAVVETSSSTVWRVQYDRRMSKPLDANTTHSIRTIAWGRRFIAIGGTGNAVSILAPIEPYPVLHTITGTDVVCSLSWRGDSSILAIASRDDRCLIVNVCATSDGAGGPPGTGRHIQSQIISSLVQADWVNAVSFNPDGTILAVGDRTGTLSLYGFEMTPKTDPVVTELTKISMLDATLSLEWSSNGRWLYAGGEDYTITVIDTKTWKKVHKIFRDKWVQFIASSNRGTHVAVGGVASEVTILDARNTWAPAMNIELKGLVPLSATWHPEDRYLVLTGQTNNVVAVETTNARHIGGHCIRSVSPILCVEFSPDGRMVAVGNASGIISLFSLTGTSFVVSYELVIAVAGSLSIAWSSNGSYVVVGSGDSLAVVGKTAIGTETFALPNNSGFYVMKVIRGLETVHDISIDWQGRFVALGGSTTRILDSAEDFSCVREWQNGCMLANSWASDGAWLAMIGKTEYLTIYDTTSDRLGEWRLIFSIKTKKDGRALAWAPCREEGLQYLAYGGDDRKVTVIEIRTKEGSWEKVLEIPRDDVINSLDWSPNGMLAIALGDGIVSLVDLAYLQSGLAVSEMDYNWQRQGITCFTEIRRNKGQNSMQTARWMPFTGFDYTLLGVGGTDGEFEIIDLTERRRCRGFSRPESDNIHEQNQA